MMDNDSLHKKLCDIEELLQMVFKTQDWNTIGTHHPQEGQWVTVVDLLHEDPVEAQYANGKFYYGEYLNFYLPDDHEGYWLPTQQAR